MTGQAKRIIIHAGMPKTGTTSIQAALRTNSAMLRDAGVMYPGPEDDTRLGDKPNHVAYFAALTGRSANNSGMESLEACRASLDDVVAKFGADDALRALVISHELLAIDPEKMGGSQAAQWNDKFDVSVVIYVRPLREWTESRFKQTVWALVRGREKERNARFPAFSVSIMKRLDRVLPSTIHDGLSEVLPGARIEMRSYMERRKQNDLVQHFVDEALPDGAELAGPLDMGEKSRNRTRDSALIMLAYQMLLGGVSSQTARDIVSKALVAENRATDRPPHFGEPFSFCSDEHFKQLEEVDRQEAERFPGLMLDCPIERKAGVKTSLSRDEYNDILNWLKADLPASAYDEAVAHYAPIER